MIHLYYRALDAHGQRHEGGASSSTALEETLQRKELQLIYRRWRLGRPPGRHRLSSRNLLNFCFQTAHLLEAGVPLLEALDTLGSSEDEAQRSSHPCFATIAQQVRQGQSLSNALKETGAFDPIFCQLVHAGEHTGTLPETLIRLHTRLTWQEQLRRQTQKAMIYPAFLAMLMMSATAALLIFLVPPLKSLLLTLGGDLPLASRTLFAAADFLAHAGWALGLILIGLLLLSQVLLKQNPRLRMHWARTTLRLPLWGKLQRALALAQITHTLAQLYAAGLPLLDSLNLCARTVRHPVFAQALRWSSQRVQEGSSLHASFAEQQLFPPPLLRMLHAAELSGRLDLTLRQLAQQLDHDIEHRIQHLQTLLEPALTVFMGLLLGWVMLALLGPMYDLIQLVRP